MKLLADLAMYGRFAMGLPGFLRNPITLDQARAIVQRQLERREENFLRLLEHGVFGYARSPYRPLLELAGCTFGDLRAALRTHGIEATLRRLRDAGVFFTFEEYKGREPVVRDGRQFQISPRDFANPHLKHFYYSSTSGSTGARSRVDTDLDHLSALAPHAMLTQAMHGVLDAPYALWRPILPSGSGINLLLQGARVNQTPVRWFSPLVPDDGRPPIRFRVATYGTVVLGRLCGVRLPWPETVSLTQASVIARWAAQTVRASGSCVINTVVSCAVRVCAAALEERLDLRGATFAIAGEPPTPAKVQWITNSGARYFTTYGLAETGRVAMGCGSPATCNDLHVLKDAFAMLQYPRRAAGFEMVPAFNLTTLLPTTPAVLLNVEIDDYGILEQRSCGCPWEAYGFTEHVRDIHSFRKLTGEGVTLVGSEMLEILEEVLPSRFGGGPLDYQLVEEEDATGLTRLVLVIDPSLAISDETAPIRCVLDGLARGTVAAASAGAIWRQADTLRVARRKPAWTSAGKLMPLRPRRAVAAASQTSAPHD